VDKNVVVVYRDLAFGIKPDGHDAVSVQGKKARIKLVKAQQMLG
jgi:hypothetical protein